MKSKVIKGDYLNANIYQFENRIKLNLFEYKRLLIQEVAKQKKSDKTLTWKDYLNKRKEISRTIKNIELNLETIENFKVLDDLNVTSTGKMLVGDATLGMAGVLSGFNDKAQYISIELKTGEKFICCMNSKLYKVFYETVILELEFNNKMITE